MCTEDAIAHDRRDRQILEGAVEFVINTHIVALFALFHKAPLFIDGLILVVPTEHEECARELNLEGEQQADCFYLLPAAVNVVTQEQVVVLRGIACELEQAQQVRILAVDVTADLDGRIQLQQHGLRE